MGGFTLFIITVIILTVIGTTLLFYMIYVAHHDILTHEEISSRKLSPSITGLHIFFIADVHRRKIRNETLNKVQQSIDFVLIGGDLTERNVSFHRTRNNIIKLKKWEKPIYFVWGNNDDEVNTQKLINLLQEENVIILKDVVETLYIKNERMNLIGFNYYKDTDIHPTIDWSAIDRSYTILLTHQPSDFYQLSDHEKSQVDLVLAGHTHGGQIRICGFGFYENGGLKQHAQTKVFVTEGYGYSLLPLRLQTKAECHVITVKYESI